MKVWSQKNLEDIRHEYIDFDGEWYLALLKSRQFYNNAFDTSVNYEDLMALKKELMR